MTNKPTVFRCSYEGCKKEFKTYRGRRNHIERVHGVFRSFKYLVTKDGSSWGKEFTTEQLKHPTDSVLMFGLLFTMNDTLDNINDVLYDILEELRKEKTIS